MWCTARQTIWQKYELEKCGTRQRLAWPVAHHLKIVIPYQSQLEREELRRMSNVVSFQSTTNWRHDVRSEIAELRSSWSSYVEMYFFSFSTNLLRNAKMRSLNENIVTWLANGREQQQMNPMPWHQRICNVVCSFLLKLRMWVNRPRAIMDLVARICGSGSG